MDFALNIPINSVSFGQLSVGILRYLHSIGKNPVIFPIGNIDLSTQEIDQNFGLWLQTNINRSLSEHKREIPVFKLWHINSSLESVSKKQCLLTFYETDSPTDQELNILSQQELVFVTSKYTKNILEFAGLSNIRKLDLFFDSYNFNKKNKNYISNRITFNICGKFEKRKNHERVIKTWIKKFGNNPKYFLNCAIYNPFLSPEDNQRIVSYLLEGKSYFNVNFLGVMPKNIMYNDFLNSSDVIIGMGTEGWGLPEFHSVSIGKHALILNCAGYAEWATKENSVLISPNGKVEIYDDIFFKKGQIFNQGNMFTFSEDSLIQGFNEVIDRVNINRINENGLLLQQKFTVENTVETIQNAMLSI